MHRKTCRVFLGVALVISAAAWAFAGETTLYDFDNSIGTQAWGGVIMDAAGNLYGTVALGGPNGAGSVFELQKTANGWNPILLYAFTGGNDGGFPIAGLIFDAAGNLYGTAQAGGANNQGVVFELSPSGNGWTETVLYAFSGPDGSAPAANLARDHAGNFYGTTRGGGTYGWGTVFELSPSQNGWTFTTLHQFTGSGGSGPLGGLILDRAGNLYGTAFGGGNYNSGTVYRMRLIHGTWSYENLYNFTGGDDGKWPTSALLLDQNGALYGAASSGAYQGGSCGEYEGGCGTVFRLSPPPTNVQLTVNASWQIHILHVFTGFADGGVPYGQLIWGPSGSLIGTTYLYGNGNAGGTVFQLNPTPNGWNLNTLYTFQGGADGAQPYSGVIADQAGNYYGTNVDAGTNGGGAVFEITPN